MNPRVAAMIKRHEGFRGQPYDDGYGNVTIAFGRNLSANPLTVQEGEYLLEHDIQRTHETCLTRIPFYAQLDEVRQAAVLDLAYNMGVTTLLTFENTLAAIEQGD